MIPPGAYRCSARSAAKRNAAVSGCTGTSPFRIARRNLPVAEPVGSAVKKALLQGILFFNRSICVDVPEPSIPSKTIKLCNTM